MFLCVSIFKNDLEECVTIVISKDWVTVTFIFLIIYLLNVDIFCNVACNVIRLNTRGKKKSPNVPQEVLK